jgi:hypothetical protein
MPNHRQDVEREVIRDFEELRTALEKPRPGVMTALQVYGGYEAGGASSPTLSAVLGAAAAFSHKRQV